MNPACRAAARTSLAVAALALVAGCSATNPQTTQSKYTPADGETAQAGPVMLANMVVVASAEDAPGAFVARLVNTSSEAQTVTITADPPSELDQTFRVPARSTLAVGPEGDQAVTIDPVGVVPGELIPMVVSTTGGQSSEVTVPVLSGEHAELAPLVPSPTPSSPRSTPTSPGVAGVDADGSGEGGEDSAGDPGDIGEAGSTTAPNPD